MGKNWKHWDKETGYGEVLYKRAIGELPEMESSKSVASVLKRHIRQGDSLLDVGCGAGHYLRSLKAQINYKFYYTGVDTTKNYLDFAIRAFANDKNANFKLSDIYHLDFNDDSFDIVMCNNLLLHLPSIKQPLFELIRVAKRKVLIRSLFGDRSFRVQEVRRQDNREEFDQNGEPLSFGFYNIYGRSYIEDLLSSNGAVKSWELTFDDRFSEQNILSSVKEHVSSFNATTIIGGYQVNGYILLPWSILEITL